MFQADDRSLIVLVDWVGFEVDERTWEPLKEIIETAPEFLAKELRKLRVESFRQPCLFEFRNDSSNPTFLRKLHFVSAQELWINFSRVS